MLLDFPSSDKINGPVRCQALKLLLLPVYERPIDHTGLLQSLRICLANVQEWPFAFQQDFVECLVNDLILLEFLKTNYSEAA